MPETEQRRIVCNGNSCSVVIGSAPEEADKRTEWERDFDERALNRKLNLEHPHMLKHPGYRDHLMGLMQSRISSVGRAIDL
jgi:hypothetical protein